MTMTTVLIVNIALDVAVFTGVLALAAWAIRTGESDPGPPDHGPEADGGPPPEPGAPTAPLPGLSVASRGGHIRRREEDRERAPAPS
jgi:hypothetical protein